MAKHALDPIDDLQVPLRKFQQESVGKVHARACTPRHSAGWYSPAELTTAYNMGVAEFNARQSDFYETHDRTEDARGE